MKNGLLGRIGIVGTWLAVATLSGMAQAATAEQLTSGIHHLCARTPEGAAYCWGGGTSGQLGNGTLLSSTTPSAVSGLSSGVNFVVAGYQHTCALVTGGTVRCWGRNDTAQLGDGSITNRSLPVAVQGLTNAIALGAGTYHTCAVTGAGGVKCWGSNNQGALGDGTTATRRTTPVDVVGVTGAVAVSPGLSHTCALLANGRVQCWGLNAYGQLGNGTLTGSSTRVDVVGITDAVALVTGQYHTCVKTASGAMKCWGRNDYGQIGNGGAANVSAPVTVSGLAGGVSSVLAPSGGGSACAVLDSGGAKCWGYNGQGQLGTGDRLNRSLPADVTGLAGPILRMTIGGTTACARVYNGVQCWGGNNLGQHGAGNTVNVLFPQYVVGF
jgi:alpha-tubulin suppressor-like RCC1 family protein